MVPTVLEKLNGGVKSEIKLNCRYVKFLNILSCDDVETDNVWELKNLHK